MTMNDRRKTGSERRRPGVDYEPGSELAASADPVARLSVRKTWKLYVNGAFVRSESGRYLVTADGVDNYPWSSRKDGRDAVTAAQGAQRGWAGKTAYNRGQILYRLGEVMEGRRAELSESLSRGGTADADREVDAAIDRVVSYAGWSDKYQSLFASSNPVSGPHFGFSIPDAMGVVAVAAPDRPSLLGLVGSVCPIIVSGNTAVVLVSEPDPLTALLWAECLATSDLPNGVVNLLSGKRAEVLPHLAKHMGVRALDLWSLPEDVATQIETLAADNVKRVSRREWDAEGWFDESRGVSPGNIERFVETKTVWHPMGA